VGFTTYVLAAPAGTVLAMSGRIDDDSAAAFEEFLLRAARAHHAPLLLDLSRVDSMDRGALAALMTMRNLTAARDCRLRVIAASPPVRTLLYLAGVQHVLDEAPRAVHAPALRATALAREGAASLGVTRRARSRSAARRRHGRRSLAAPA
jgi:anti-sigma B factor antagonist